MLIPCRRVILGLPTVTALGRTKFKWDDNIITALQVVDWKGMDWTDVAQDKHK